MTTRRGWHWGSETWARHLEGWPLAVIAVGMGLLALVLFLPRPATTLVLPLPPLGWREATRLSDLDRSREREVESGPLPFNVRAVGEAIRTYGKKEHGGDASAADLSDVRRMARKARQAEGAEALLRLRAVELGLFRAALAEFFESGVASDDLVELGGSFLKRAQNSHWFGGRYPILPLELETLFRIRWTELTDLGEDSAFKVTLNEWRIYYGFLLRRFDPRLERLAVGVGYAQALARRDTSYPVLLATGVLYFHYQAYPLAAQAFQRHLEMSQHGAWSLAARNYLAAALMAASGGES